MPLFILIFLLSSLSLAEEEKEKCSNCGEFIEKGSAFCSFCGAKLRDAFVKEKIAQPEEILKEVQKSIFCISALHHRYLYHAWGDKDIITHLLGTAFMIKEGFVLTDLSIVDQAKEIRMINHKGKLVPCEIFGKDYLYGIAVLKVDDKHLKALEWKQEKPIRIGDTIYAIGFPSTKGEAKVGVSIGKGIVSALEKSAVGLKQYENFIQIDVPFTEGMNGGPLLDHKGNVVGMIAMRLYSKGYYSKRVASVGFASPLQDIMKAAEKIIEGKLDIRGWLGVALDEIGEHPDDELRRKEKGIFAEFIIPDSPAEKAGLRSGDILLSLNGSPIEKIHTFQQKICSLSPGTTIELKIKNKKGTKSFQIILSQRPERIRLSPEDMLFWLSGLRFQEGEKKYLTVSYVKEGSYAHNIGFRKGNRLDDILVKKDYKSEAEDYDFFNVRSWKDFKKVVNRGFSDYDFLLLLRFKEKDGTGFQKKLFIYGFLQDFPTA